MSRKLPRHLQLLNHQRHAIIDRDFRGAPASGDASRMRRIEAALDCWERTAYPHDSFIERMTRSSASANQRLAEIERELGFVSPSVAAGAIETVNGGANAE